MFDSHVVRGYSGDSENDNEQTTQRIARCTTCTLITSKLNSQNKPLCAVFVCGVDCVILFIFYNYLLHSNTLRGVSGK
jgi:hypothetical protein